MGQVDIVVGAQWGDEGKGKWVDLLANEADIVARYQGGNNAGHTIYVDGEKFVLHQIPSGVYQGKVAAIGSQVVVNPGQLLDEIETVAQKTQLTPDNLWISRKSHVITPWQIHQDVKRESQAYAPIGTTKRGIGPTYSDRASRSGLRVGQYTDRRQREAWLRTMRQDREFDAFFTNHIDEWQSFSDSAERIRPFLCELEKRLSDALAQGRRVLAEGAQGALLDIDHGTYPFVTSSSTLASAAFPSLGIAPQKIGTILGIAKAYTTRVGAGPFPTELTDEAGQELARKGQEFGATTGRPRRCGWLDALALEYVARINGLDEIVLNKLDILSGFSEIKIAVAYDHPTLGRLDHFPSEEWILAEVEPVYETFRGWKEELPASGTLAQLPAAAQEFLAGVERTAKVKVARVGTGPGRHDVLCGSA